MKYFLYIASLLLVISLTSDARAQTGSQTTDLLTLTETSKATATDLLNLEQSNVTKLTASLEQLRQLYSEGLVARVEVEKAEQELATAKSKVEQTQNQIASAQKLSTEIQKAAELARTKSLVRPTLLAINRSAIVTRATGGNWSLTQLSGLQQFFSSTFGRALPTSAIGQSAIHNKLGWDHRNAVDVGLHPDSVEGRALISYLKSAGIPFLAFRSAIPGVATGPHIHIGNPSHHLG